MLPLQPLPNSKRRSRSGTDDNVHNDDDDNNIVGNNACDEHDGSSSVAANGIRKEYCTVLCGVLREPVDIRFRIGFESSLPPSEVPSSRKLKKIRVACRSEDDVAFGRAARTEVIPLAVGDGVTLCCVRLHTGRTHQIRIHCAAIGLPLVGEKLYLAGGGSVDCDTFLARARGEVPVVQLVGPSSDFPASSSQPCGARDHCGVRLGGGPPKVESIFDARRVLSPPDVVAVAAAAAVATHSSDTALSGVACSIAQQPQLQRRVCAARHLLHAASLTIRHPSDPSRELTFVSDPWQPFVEACPQLTELFDAAQLASLKSEAFRGR